MEEEQEEASDTGCLSSRAPVANSFATGRRAHDDDLGNENGHENVYYMDLPLRGAFQCTLCTSNVRCFLSELQWMKHMENDHPTHRIRWRCTICSKAWTKIHACRCHIPKCKGAPSMPDTSGSLKCAACGMNFKTLRGLSQHERHKHPVIRNEKRCHAAQPSRSRNRNTVWTENEMRLLIELNEQFKNDTRINVKIHERLPSKTIKQISDKRRRLPVHVVEAAAETSDTNTPNSQITANENAVEQYEREEHSIEGNDEWKEALRRQISMNDGQNVEDLRGIEQDIIGLAECEQIDAADIDRVVSKYTEELISGVTDNRKRNNGGGKRNGKRRSNKTRLSKFNYARYQDLYNNCPKKLIEMAISGEKVRASEKVTLPEKEDIERLYSLLWGVPGPPTRQRRGNEQRSDVLHAAPPREIWTPITTEEIIDKMRRIKSNTAPGPDGITKVHLKKKGALHVLAKLLNLLLLHNSYPTQWKQNRTTLIPKPGKDMREASNWRPITIGSLMARIFSAMLDRRLRRIICNHQRQKGFTREDGCKQNISILECALKNMKFNKGGVITVMDIAKAFDTVPWNAMAEGLRKKNIPMCIIEYIANMYKNCQTRIKTNSGEVSITLRRGVKQGDPLSPILFNTTIDPIIDDIEEMSEGIDIESKKVSILAFADDIVLLAKDKSEAKKQVKVLHTFLQSMGMNIEASKCHAFQIIRKNKTWYVDNPKIKVGAEYIPDTDPNETIKYLGIKMDPWTGLIPFKIDEIVDAAKNIKKMALKPHQKVNLIRTHLLPKYIHKLVANPPPIKTLKALDHEIKQVVKEALHLHPTVTDGLIYAEKKHGGLGLQSVADIVRIAKLKNGLKMENNDDEVVKAAYKEQQGIMEKYARSINLQWPCTEEEIERKREELKRNYIDQWRQLVSQGHGIHEFMNDKIGNAWLVQPTLLKSSRYIDALRLRTNTYGTKVALKRARKEIDPQCRRCRNQVETLGHILGICTHTKPARIRRHDEIVSAIEEITSKKWAVFKEATVNVLGELKKPDLVIKDQDRLLVVDVTVRYEDKDNLKRAHKDKETKYKDTAEYLKRRLNCVSASVLPIVVGCRGSIPLATKRNMEALGLNKSQMRTISLIALRSSIEMANAFMDYDHIT